MQQQQQMLLMLLLVWQRCARCGAHWHAHALLLLPLLLPFQSALQQLQLQLLACPARAWEGQRQQRAHPPARCPPR